MLLRIMHRYRVLSVWMICGLLHTVTVHAGTGIVDHEFSGRLSAVSRWFPESALHPDQRSHASGFVAVPNLFLEDEAGRILIFTPFFRFDSADAQRTRFDLREAFILLSGALGKGEWELRLGIDRLFWGVVESRHLVDIVNQIDLIEHPNEKTRIGQPLAYLTWSADWGVVELLGLPYHRARTFPGRHGRLRGSLIVDDSFREYESSSGKWHPDFAARFSHSVGLVDFGVSAFLGTAREPFFGLCTDCGDQPALYPIYDQIRQFGLDTQLTTGPWLFKLETIRRSGARNLLNMEEDFTAFVLGGEYSFYSLWNSDTDLTLFAEWDRDGRGRRATNFFENDLFLAARLALNDVQSTELFASVLNDMGRDQRIFTVELSRRLTDTWSINLEAIAISDIDEADLYYDLRRDSFVQFNLNYSF